LSSCLTGARQEAEVLFTATAFLGLQLKRYNDYTERRPKIGKEARDHLEEHWTFNFGHHEYLLARLDIIEGRQGDSQAQALVEIQQARVLPFLGRGSISAETYQLPADTRAKVSAATSRKPWRTNNRGPSPAGSRRTLPRRRAPSLSRPDPAEVMGSAPFARVATHAEKCQQIGATPTLLRWIRYGVLIP
jgi:hypothetical protein